MQQVCLSRKGDEQKLDVKTVCAVQMALYTGLRDNSIRGAQWREINLQNATWTVPSSRMKSGREHVIPLPTQAVAALTNLMKLTYRDDESLVFPGGGKHKIMSENTIRHALHSFGFKVTAHGMRSLITDVLNENQSPCAE